MSFEDLLKELQGQKEQKETGETSLKELFGESFMTRYTKHGSFEAFLEKGNFQVETQEDIAQLPDEFFDRHVVRETDFDSWKSMLDEAKKQHEQNGNKP